MMFLRTKMFPSALRMLSKVILSLVGMQLVVTGQQATDEMKHKLQLHDGRVSKQHEIEAVSWVKENWSKVYPRVVQELNKQASLRNVTLDADGQDLSLVIDNSEPKWSGKWALALTGMDSAFGSTYCYYLEFQHAELRLTRVLGVGFVLGAPHSKRVKDFMANADFKKLPDTQFSEHELEIMQGAWILSSIKRTGILYESFGADWNGAPEDLTGKVILNINNDLTFSLSLPYSGAKSNVFRGSLRGCSLNRSGEIIFIDNLGENKAADHKPITLVSFTEVDTMYLWCNGEQLRFERPLKATMIDLSQLDAVTKSRVGIMKSPR